MPRFYEQEELDKIHAFELGILKDFMKLCDSHDLQYFAVAGTGIGAIRHGGFIPWDDDIDICLPRRDFEKFCRYAKEEYGDKYYLLNAETCENYPLTSTRWCMKGTRFVEEAFQEVDAPLGIFLDVYAYDNLADDPLLYNLQVWEAWFWSKLLILRSMRNPYLGNFGSKTALLGKACAAVHDILCACHVSKRWLYNRCKKACTRYNRVKTARFGYPCDPSPHWNTLYKSKTLPTKKWKFEDVMLNFPNDMEAMLRGFYKNDYMNLPPVEKRKTHYPFVLDFGDGEKREEPKA